jgi:hypothetical protein
METFGMSWRHRWILSKFFKVPLLLTARIFLCLFNWLRKLIFVQGSKSSFHSLLSFPLRSVFSQFHAIFAHMFSPIFSSSTFQVVLPLITGNPLRQITRHKVCKKRTNTVISSSCLNIHVWFSEHDVHLLKKIPYFYLEIISSNAYVFLATFHRALNTLTINLLCLFVIPNPISKNAFWINSCKLVNKSPTVLLPKLNQPVINSGQRHLFWARWI